MNFLGIDLGGTSVKYSLIDIDGNMSVEGTFPTVSKDADELLQKLIKIAEQYKTKYNIQGIGIACPGIIHPYEGRALWANMNMPKGWHEVVIKKTLESILKIPVVVDNDVNCAALGEKWLGAGQDYHTFICIAMGTGIGSGIVINDKLYYGAGFQAGEIGYIRANRGSTVFWEKNASTLALVKRIKDTIRISRSYAEEEIIQIDGKWIFDKYHSDQQIAFVVDDWADILAGGIADAVSILNPQAVILGGGVSAQEQKLLDLIVPRVSSYLPKGFMIEIVIAKTGNNAAQLGIIKRLLDEYINK
ncbi:MAG: ROK family protein [Spirochaetota bacterium]|nr:ROK family protein [Spirochaetota bacterium]